MSGQHRKDRKNARETFRLKTDAEELAAELERGITALHGTVGRLRAAHDAEYDDRPAPEGDPTAEALHVLGRIKGAMYLERVAAGLPADALSSGSGWKAHTLTQFENRDADALVSSLFRYAAGLRRAGVKGHLEIRWVREEATEGSQRDALAA